MYKEASIHKLRFSTSKGSLSTEQLWDLSPAELDNLAVSLEEEYKGSGKKSFITGNSGKDKIAKIKFDVVLDVLNTKLEEAEQARKAKEDKEHNENILEIIAGKEDEKLKGKSIKELKAMLR